MAGKKKTTFAKLARERKLQERRMEKQAKKDARKLAGPLPPTPHDEAGEDDADTAFDEPRASFDEPHASLDAADAIR